MGGVYCECDLARSYLPVVGLFEIASLREKGERSREESIYCFAFWGLV